MYRLAHTFLRLRGWLSGKPASKSVRVNGVNRDEKCGEVGTRREKQGGKRLDMMRLGIIRRMSGVPRFFPVFPVFPNSATPWMRSFAGRRRDRSIFLARVARSQLEPCPVALCNPVAHFFGDPDGLGGCRAPARPPGLRSCLFPGHARHQLG